MVIDKLCNQITNFLFRLPNHYAAIHGFFEIAIELLEKNSDQAVVNAQDVKGR